jgi:hypothetical protein
MEAMTIKYDFSYCENKGFDECKKCKRNLKLYSYSGSRGIWRVEPMIQDDKCIDFVSIVL